MKINNLLDILSTLSFYTVDDRVNIKFKKEDNVLYSVIEGNDLVSKMTDKVCENFKEISSGSFFGVELKKSSSKNAPSRLFYDEDGKCKWTNRKDDRFRYLFNEQLLKKKDKKDIIANSPMIEFPRGDFIKQEDFSLDNEKKKILANVISDMLNNKIPNIDGVLGIKPSKLYKHKFHPKKLDLDGKFKIFFEELDICFHITMNNDYEFDEYFVEINDGYKKDKYWKSEPLTKEDVLRFCAEHNSAIISDDISFYKGSFIDSSFKLEKHDKLKVFLSLLSLELFPTYLSKNRKIVVPGYKDNIISIPMSERFISREEFVAFLQHPDMAYFHHDLGKSRFWKSNGIIDVIQYEKHSINKNSEFIRIK